MASTDKAVYTIELNDRLTPGVKKAIASSIGLDKQMGKTHKGVGKNSRGLGALGAGFARLAGPIAIATAAMKAFSIASDSVNIAREFETLENAISFASGSAQEGARNMAFLRKQSKTLGLPLKESAEGFKTLAASMMESSLEGDPTREIFNSVSVAASAMGLSAEDAKGTFLALGQIMGKGKVQAEELRGQIGERIPGAFNIAARAMGKTQAELNKMMDNGELVAEEFLPKFAAELKNTFQGALPKAMNSSQAQLNRFNNMWLELKLKLGRALLPMVNTVMGWITKLVNFLGRHKQFIMDNIFEPLREVFNMYTNAYKELFNELTDGFSSSASAGDYFRGIIIGIGKVLKFLVPIIKFTVKVMTTMWKIIIGAWKLQFKIVIKIWQFLYSSIMLVVDNIRLRFLGLKDIIAGAFSLDKDQIAKGIKTYASAGSQAAKNFSDRMSKDITIGDVFSKAAQTIGLAGKEANPDNKRGPYVHAWKGYTGVAGPMGPSTKIPFRPKETATGTATTGSKETSTSVDEIKSGRPTHINIDIGKLIENMNITAQNLEDFQGQIKDQVAQALMSAVNNVNNIAGT